MSTALDLVPYLGISALTITLAWLVVEFDGRAADASTTPREGRRVSVRGQKLYANITLTVLMLSLIAFSGLRLNTGTDYPLYARLLEQLNPAQPWWPQIVSSTQDSGFVLLSLISLSITSDLTLLFVISAALTVVPFTLAIRHSSAPFPLAMLLFVLLSGYLFPMNLVRQGIAVALNFYSWRYLDSHRERFVLINAIAFSFHASAGVAAFLQFALRNQAPTRRYYLWLVALSIASIAVVFAPIDSLLSASDNRYAQYILTARQSLSDVGLGTIAGLTFRAFTLAYTARSSLATSTTKRLQTFAALSVPFMAAGIMVAPIARMELYFLPAFFLLIPLVARARRATSREIGFIVVAATVFFCATLVSFYGLLPYAWGVGA